MKKTRLVQGDLFMKKYLKWILKDVWFDKKLFRFFQLTAESSDEDNPEKLGLHQ